MSHATLDAAFHVFHLGQCEGIEVEAAGAVQPVASCEAIVIRNGPRIVSGEPAYLPSCDLITMPSRDRFKVPEAYYGALFHELTHWTGHFSRLNRPGIVEPNRFGSERYSREELTAEMGAAFLCAMTGTDLPVLANQAAYIAGWLRHIQHGSAADIIRAAADAQRAADYLIREGEDPSPSSGAVLGQAISLARSPQSLALVFFRSLLCLRHPHSLVCTRGGAYCSYRTLGDSLASARSGRWGQFIP